MQPTDEYAIEPEDDYESEYEEIVEIEEEAIDYLALAVDAYTTSNSYFSSSMRKQLERNINQFHSKHPAGSKYHTNSYKYRSKIFRPKTRSTIRRHETAAATAYFSTSDIVNCKAVNQSDEMAIYGAKVIDNLINTRLQEPSMKWFHTCLGAYQDAMVQGCVISRHEWLFDAKEEEMESSTTFDQEGLPVSEFKRTILTDRPSNDLVPLENFRFDPNCDWRDPVSTSPYLIEIIPMYRGEVKSQDGWNLVDDEELNSHGAEYVTNLRQQGKEDPKNVDYVYSDYDIIWVHRNIVNIESEDMIYYTLGTSKLLSDPVPLGEEFPNGRPYIIGFCNLETHKPIPASPVELYSGIQAEANDIANQRMDNVKLVVNRRTFVRRNAKIDVRGLTNSVPGGVTLVDDVDRDVRHDAPPDVTSSSYAEQDRLNNDFDELAGSFSGSSVASNRAMNKTVGGMEIMSADASSITEYQLRIFSETWLKPALQHMIALEQTYESDKKRLLAAGGGNQDINQIMQSIKSDIVLNLAVGYGATNPQKQVEKLSFAIGTIANFMPDKMKKIKANAVFDEVFGALGYQDGQRFFDLSEEENPEVAQLKQQLQQMQQQLQSKEMDNQTKIQVEQVKQDGNMQREQIRNQTNKEIAALDQQINYIKQQIAAEKNDISRGELAIQESAFDFSKKEKELEVATGERNRMSDLLMNDDYGMAPGIEEQPGRG